LCQDFGLGIGDGVMIEGRELGIELDLKTLLRMDSASLHQMLREDIRGSLMSIDDARAEIDLEPVPGGNTIWMQQQNYSLDALVQRDKNDPFAKPAPAPTPPATDPANPPADPPPDPAKALEAVLEPLASRIDAIDRGLKDIAGAPPVNVADVIRETLEASKPTEDDAAERFVAALQKQFETATEE
jgi:hypothetical protein